MTHSADDPCGDCPACKITKILLDAKFTLPEVCATFTIVLQQGYADELSTLEMQMVGSSLH